MTPASRSPMGDPAPAELGLIASLPNWTQGHLSVTWCLVDTGFLKRMHANHKSYPYVDTSRGCRREALALCPCRLSEDLFQYRLSCYIWRSGIYNSKSRTPWEVYSSNRMCLDFGNLAAIKFFHYVFFHVVLGFHFCSQLDNVILVLTFVLSFELWVIFTPSEALCHGVHYFLLLDEGIWLIPASRRLTHVISLGQLEALEELVVLYDLKPVYMNYLTFIWYRIWIWKSNVFQQFFQVCDILILIPLTFIRIKIWKSGGIGGNRRGNAKGNAAGN